MFKFIFNFKKKKNKFKKFIFRSYKVTLFLKKSNIFTSVLFKLLIQSKLIFSFNDFKYILRNQLLLINGNNLIFSKYSNIKNGDLVKIKATKFYYFYLYKKSKSTLDSLYKFKWRHIKKLSLNGKIFFHSKYFNNIIYLNIKKNIKYEVDYLTLSIFLLNNYSFNRFFNNYPLPIFKLKLLNWKY